jgi:hypothetical protein
MLSVPIIALHGHAFDCACPIPNALIGGIDQDQLGHAGAGLFARPTRRSAMMNCDPTAGGELILINFILCFAS